MTYAKIEEAARILAGGYPATDPIVAKVNLIVETLTAAGLSPEQIQAALDAAAALVAPDPDDGDDFDDTDDPDGDLIDGVGFQDPGGNSALRAATLDNPRCYPCPTCGTRNALTRLDVARGYQCDDCADRMEFGY